MYIQAYSGICRHISDTFAMNSTQSEEMFDSDSVDTCTWKFLLMSMTVRAEGLACADPEARTPIGPILSLYLYELYNTPHSV